MPRGSRAPRVIARHVEGRVSEALDDTRIVALVGPRQSGKTTLARKLSTARNMTFITLDDEQYRQFASDDPTGFIRNLDSAAIDEIQRAPGLILALKKTVDEDPRPGRFLITGSVDLFSGTISPDSLAGRVETIELLPFSQSEIEQRPPSAFVANTFNGDFPVLKETGVTSELIQRVVRGGYPEAVARSHHARRQAWLSEYIRSLTTRDVVEIAEVSKTSELSRLIDYTAVSASQTVNMTALAMPLRVDAKTVERWLFLLEQMFVIRRVAAWHRNDLKRLVKTPKLHFLDSGLLCALRRISRTTIKEDRSRLGPLLEGFVFSELSKLVSHNPDSIHISHYRDRDQVEVDFVLEMAGRIVGIEVKSAVSVGPADFHGLKRLRDATGRAFASGIILHDGNRIQRTGDRLFAMPVGMLWSET